MRFNELDAVETAESIDGAEDCYRSNVGKVSLPIGSRGTVLLAFGEPREAYDVEFLGEDGSTKAIVTLKAHQVRLPHTEKEGR